MNFVTSVCIVSKSNSQYGEGFVLSSALDTFVLHHTAEEFHERCLLNHPQTNIKIININIVNLTNIHDADMLDTPIWQ